MNCEQCGKVTPKTEGDSEHDHSPYCPIVETASTAHVYVAIHAAKPEKFQTNLPLAGGVRENILGRKMVCVPSDGLRAQNGFVYGCVRLSLRLSWCTVN